MLKRRDCARLYVLVSEELASLVDVDFADSNLNINDYIMNMNTKSLPADVGLQPNSLFWV